MAEAVLEGVQPTDAIIEPEASPTDKALEALEKDLLGDPKPATEAPKVETPPAGAPKAEKTLDEIIDGIEEPKPEEKPAAAQLSPEQKQVLEVFPDAQHATQALNIANGYIAFTNTIANGDFQNTEAMLEKWNPEATTGLREYFFEKYVRNGDWVDRWVAEKEGRGEENKDVRTLKTQVNKLEKQLETKKTEEASQAQNAQFQQTVQGFVGHVEALFKQIGADDTDKQIMWPLINAQVGSNEQVRQAMNRRDYKSVNSIFKSVSKTYFGKTKTVADSKAAKQTAQEQHKPPVQAGAMQELSGQLPSDVKEVPKGKLDDWVDQELGKLAKGRKK